jgi:2,3-bisphosphoglycerate-independent phosphoglycerate mutase
VNGKGLRASSASEAIEQSYKKKVVDEFIEPTIVHEKDRTPKFVGNNDSVIFFNFRPDRARQLTKAFVQGDLNYFTRPSLLDNIYFVSMTEYERNLEARVAFPAPVINNPLSFIISTNNIKQLHIGETEKYAHVTYFFNGGLENSFPLEERVHIPSPRVTTFDLKPEMSAYPLTKYVIQKLKSPQYGFYVINFANADMVAHTGSLEATKKAVEVLDQCVGKIVSEVLPLGGTVVLVGDHGNAEQMINPLSKGVDTEHTSNPVPFLAISGKLKGKNTQLQSGILADVAPTVLFLMGLSKPTEMTGRNLFM